MERWLDRSQEQQDVLEMLGVVSPADSRAAATPAIGAPKTVMICGSSKVTVNPLLQMGQYPIPTP